MDFKNVLIAIVLSTLVLIGWATFFEPPIVEQQTTENEITKNEDLSSPSIDEGKKEIKNEITRNDVINNTKRIKVENENIKGSISLQGAIIDDIIFKNYNETLNGENKVIFLNPKNSSKEYFMDCLKLNGILKGSFLGIKRILRCHPIKILGGRNGYDPAPDLKKEKK